MREIEFRGKSMGGHWEYGLLTKKKIRNSGKLSYAIATGDCSSANTIPISEESIGQFTGAYDCDGKKIFKGDILLTTELSVENARSFKAVVLFGNGTFYAKYFNLKDCMDISSNVPLYMVLKFSNSVKVIGNTFDTLEFLEGGSND